MGIALLACRGIRSKNTVYFAGEFSSKTMVQVSLSDAARRLQFSSAFLRALSGVICAVEEAKWCADTAKALCGPRVR
jgi:hypothetical protein